MRLGRVLVVLVLVLGVAACGSDDEPENQDTTAEIELRVTGTCESVEAPAAREDGGRQPPSERLDASKTYWLVVETNCGSFRIELDQKLAPETTASLVTLAESGFYDGTTFHRVVPDFVIQGGDPTGTGAGGPGYKTVDPPPRDAAYVRGVVAMAKTGAEPAGTSGSQFFVVTGADVGLPPDYAIVGTVSEGLETVDAIEALGTGDGPPSEPVVIEKVTVEFS